jgi:antitoxin component of MazEF toxin-antitoxin module
MPKQKIFRSGCSKVVTIPASWLHNAEKQCGHKITEVQIEVSDNLLIMPVKEVA